MKFEGAWTALVTPFGQDGQIDWDGFRKNLEFQTTQGISGLVPMGTTGESPTVNADEHSKAVSETLKHCEGRCGVLPGAGSNSTEKALSGAKRAVDMGAKALLLVDCYYNGPSSQELRDEYYTPIAEAVPGVFLVPYIIPGRTGTAMSAEDLAILAGRFSTINAVKEATGDLERMAYTRKLTGPDFSIMSGDDDLTFKMMTDVRIKSAGVISVMANVVPGPIEQMTRKVLSGDIDGATKLAEALSPLFGIVTVKAKNERTLPNGEKVMVEDKYRNPLAVKTLMNGLGMPSGRVRRPLGAMTQAGVVVVRNAAKQVWEKNPEVLQPITEFYGVDIAARLADDNCWGA